MPNDKGLKSTLQERKNLPFKRKIYKNSKGQRSSGNTVLKLMKSFAYAANLIDSQI